MPASQHPRRSRGCEALPSSGTRKAAYKLLCGPVKVYSFRFAMIEQAENSSAAVIAAAAMARALPPSSPAKPAHVSVIKLGGGGIYFWWMVGAMKELAQQCSEQGVQMQGASAGALAAVLGACNVCMDEALDVAQELAERYGVFTRLGAQGNPFSSGCMLKPS